MNKDTQLCISVSENPGNKGAQIQAALYKRYSLNFDYKSFKVRSFDGVVPAMRTLGIRGCAVAQPFKFDAYRHVDEAHDEGTGVVNTIVQKASGAFVGYNTDVFGARKAIDALQCDKSKSVVVFGAGATARSVLAALKQLGFEKVVVCNRTQWKAQELGQDIVSIQETSEIEDVGMIINATSRSMQGSFVDLENLVISLAAVGNRFGVMDVVVNPRCKGVEDACKTYNLPYITGLEMSIWQSLYQFELYTGTEYTEEDIEFVRTLELT